jgi:hypothetical protein
MATNDWMTLLNAVIGTRNLHDITIPGTHDAGCYIPQMEPKYSQTQTQDIFQQLYEGIRYFDLRPRKRDREFWTYHGPAYRGGRLDGPAGIFHDVANFMASGPVAAGQELVVLNVSHFDSFNGDDHRRLINEILNHLGQCLVPNNQTNLSLLNSPYNAVLTAPGGAPTSRVAVLYDGALDTSLQSLSLVQPNGGLPDGFFKLSPKYAGGNQIFLFDKYADKMDVNRMQTDQMTKLANRAAQRYSTEPWAPAPPALAAFWTANNPHAPPPPGIGILNTWHLFSWTLTPQPWGTPLHYAQTYANPFLEGWFTGNHWPTGIGGATRGYNPLQDQRINVIYVDHYRSHQHGGCAAGVGCPRNNFPVPVALCEFINRNFTVAPWPGWAAY